MSNLKCNDDSSRPSDIPLSMWVKKGNKYTEINRFKDMHGVELVQIEEIDLTSLGTSYKGFAASRFSDTTSPEGELTAEELEVALAFFI